MPSVHTNCSNPTFFCTAPPHPAPQPHPPNQPPTQVNGSGEACAGVGVHAAAHTVPRLQDCHVRAVALHKGQQAERKTGRAPARTRCKHGQLPPAWRRSRADGARGGAPLCLLPSAPLYRSELQQPLPARLVPPPLLPLVSPTCRCSAAVRPAGPAPTTTTRGRRRRASPRARRLSSFCLCVYQAGAPCDR